MVKKLRKEYGNKIGLIIIDDYHVPTFNPEKSVFSEQLQKNLSFSILKKVYYLFCLLHTDFI